MIYEYPEKFVVPVVYDRELGPMYRDWEFKYMKVEELLTPIEEIQEDKMFYESKNKKSKDMESNVHHKKEDSLQKSLMENKYDDCSVLYKEIDNEEIKSILSDIDNEYANSETMRI